jgi:hypothetical protein
VLHFRTPLASGRKASRHYVGWSRHWQYRVKQHRAGDGARIVQVALSRGIVIDLATVAAVVVCGGKEYRGRAAELQIKRGHHIARYCPMCGGRGATDYRNALQGGEREQ